MPVSLGWSWWHLFMLIYYRLPGLLAICALLVYGSVSLAIFKMIPVTLTLPAIAGFIISIGMAVDANILVFERMKEELRAGRTLGAAVEEGFRRAWPSIRDSNISTFITCLILYWFGGTFGAFMVQGFAITLFLGVVVSMFSALIVTRTFLRVLVGSRGNHRFVCLWSFVTPYSSPFDRQVSRTLQKMQGHWILSGKRSGSSWHQP